jgi:hypothetical protein
LIFQKVSSVTGASGSGADLAGNIIGIYKSIYVVNTPQQIDLIIVGNQSGIPGSGQLIAVGSNTPMLPQQNDSSTSKATIAHPAQLNSNSSTTAIASSSNSSQNLALTNASKASALLTTTAQAIAESSASNLSPSSTTTSTTTTASVKLIITSNIMKIYWFLF